MLLQELQAMEESEYTTNGITNQSHDMYKPEPESLETLETRKTELMNKIINGSHLDALSMDALQKQLADVRKKIEEQRKEVASGQ
jgi:small-conductance mechanosensitive channel